MSVQNNTPDPDSPDESNDASMNSDLTDVQALMTSSKACRSISTGQPEPASFDKAELQFAAGWLNTMSDIFFLGGQACESIATGHPAADSLNKDDLTIAYSTIWLMALVIEAGRVTNSN